MSTQVSPILFALYPDAGQAATLTETLRRFNSATKYVVDFAVNYLVFNGPDLTTATGDVFYGVYKLTEHMAAQAIDKAVEVCRCIPMVSGIPITGPPRIGKVSPMVVDLTGIEGDIAVLRLGQDFEERVRLEYVGVGQQGRNAGPAELVTSDGEFFLFIDAHVYTGALALRVKERQEGPGETWRQRVMTRLGLVDVTSPLQGT